MQSVRIACLLIAALPSWGAITLVAHTAAGGNSTTTTTTAIDTTGANLLVACASSFDAAAHTPTMSDNKTNTWTALTLRGTSSTTETTIYYSVPASVGTGHTFTFTTTVNGFAALGVWAFAGASATPYDTDVGTAASSSGTSVQPGSITPAQANEVLVACNTLSAAFTSLAINSSFTLSDQVAFASGNNEGGGYAYLIQTTATAENPTFSWTNTVSTSTAMAAFEAAATATVNHGSPPSIF